ncbi:hypothetical protein UU5_10006 [Rhodanobacter sp. 115]|nr:hypothetical protein UU5_10006 [Rhodanobacter sp. 115]
MVKKLYQMLSATPNPVQRAAIKAGHFDIAIGLLEDDIMHGRETVRRALASILVPDLSAPNATTTHEALLTLGRNRSGQTRLITTNFDRLFEDVIAAKSLSVERYQAPLLPVPKNRWDGLVYLHGMLTETATQGELNRLVVSSGDFGLAYLVDRWAARFVSGLFRNYTVCFVGYSINDPVLRYMMDALAADRLLGESPPEMFAFGSYSKGKEGDRANEWRAKNVTPILYREHDRHAHLHKTLRVWAETYRDGVRGKERIVAECAMTRPLASTKQDDFVGRLLWALSDPCGLPAQRFAEFDPAPSLEWLEPLSEDRYRHADLARFGVSSKSECDDKLTFSLVQRPSPYELAPLMALVGIAERGCRWDKVMGQLACWLLRHLDDPDLLLWLIKRGGQLHDEFLRRIEFRLDELAGCKPADLVRIRASAPKAIPRPMMLVLWRLLLTGRVRSAAQSFDLYGWRSRFKSVGLTTALRLQLRDVLAPRVSIREPSRWGSEDGDEPKRIRDLVEWEIVLSTDHVHSGLRDLAKDERWLAALPELLTDFCVLLRDVLDLMRELGGADDRSDLSYMHQPSISEHPQNRNFHDWTALVELTRDAWLATATHSQERARLVAEGWWQAPYPLFRRLAFFAAGQPGVIPHRLGLDWLLAEGAWWLWSLETEREVMRLLVALAPGLGKADLAELEDVILRGPPREMFKYDIGPERWSQLVDREVWLRLAKLIGAGAPLGIASSQRLEELSGRNPKWSLSADQRDEFPVWMGGSSWVGEDDELSQAIATPYRRRELVDWLTKHPVADPWHHDEWSERCRKNFPAAASALLELSRQGEWPTERWADALLAWREKSLLRLSWKHMAPAVIGMPDEQLLALAHGVSGWMTAVASVFDYHESVFFEMADRIFGLDVEDGVLTEEPLMRAINHPVGQITQALLAWWSRSELEDGQGLPTAIRDRFTRLCDTDVDKFRHGRVLLGSRLVSLFRVDEKWSRECLLPLFDWTRSETEAASAWEGFFWAPRLYRPLMQEMKRAFLDTAKHYDALSKEDSQYAAILTFAALDLGDIFSVAELAQATVELPLAGLEAVAATLVRALENSGEQKVEYWDNRISPYLQKVWPKKILAATPRVAEQFARLCIVAGERFPEAFKQLRMWIREPTGVDFLTSLLYESGLCKKFPNAALDFLGAILGDHVQWMWRHEADCLRDIQSSAPELATDQRFLSLVDFLRSRGAQWP